MTREEAIIQLRLGPGINEDVSEKYNDAVNMAIEALERAVINCVHCPRYFETEDETGVYSHCQRPGDKKE